MGVLSPIEVITDRNSIIDAEGEMPQAMSLMPLFKGCVVWTIPMNKFNYSVPHKYFATIEWQYEEAATFIYGGLRSEEHTSELQSLMRFSHAVLVLNKKNPVDKHLQRQSKLLYKLRVR